MSKKGRPVDIGAALTIELDEAESKAITALAHSEYATFGHWAEIWLHLNQVSGLKRHNPFAGFVSLAQQIHININDP